MKIKHNETTHNTQSGEYAVYHAMLQRCGNPNDRAYKNYGMRGITVYHTWANSFNAFLRDMGRRPDGYSLERIDNSKGYTPNNCKWATRSEQNRNHRRNRVITIKGQTLCLVDWCELLGVSRRTFYNRVGRGLSDIEALLINKWGKGD